MKGVAEMADIAPVLEKLPRIQQYLLDCENMRWGSCGFPSTDVRFVSFQSALWADSRAGSPTKNARLGHSVGSGPPRVLVIESIYFIWGQHTKLNKGCGRWGRTPRSP